MLLNVHMRATIKKILKEYKLNNLNELSLQSDIVEDLINNISENPFVVKEIGFKNMKQIMNYIEECDYKEFSDLRDEVNHLIKNNKES